MWNCSKASSTVYQSRSNKGSLTSSDFGIQVIVLIALIGIFGILLRTPFGLVVDHCGDAPGKRVEILTAFVPDCVDAA